MDPEQRKVRLQDVREQLRRIAELRQVRSRALRITSLVDWVLGSNTWQSWLTCFGHSRVQATDAGLARIHEKRARPPSDGQSAEKGGQDASKRAKTADGKQAGGAVAQPGRKRPLSPDGGGKAGPRPQPRPASHQRPPQGKSLTPEVQAERPRWCCGLSMLGRCTWRFRIWAAAKGGRPFLFGVKPGSACRVAARRLGPIGPCASAAACGGE